MEGCRHDVLPDVRYWHLADIAALHLNVRYWH